MSRARITALTTSHHDGPNTIHNEYMDMIQLGHVNNAYENTLDLTNQCSTTNNPEDQTIKTSCASGGRNGEKLRAVQNFNARDKSAFGQNYPTRESLQSEHDYEDPSKLMPHPLLAQYSIRHKNNDLYETTGPLRARNAFGSTADSKLNESAKEKTESCCSRLVLCLILLLSTAALVLVALMITGYIGQGCMCANQGPQRQASSSTIASIEPIMEELREMKKNMSRMSAMLMQQLVTTNSLQTQLKSAWQAIDGLEARIIGRSNTTDADRLQQQIANMENKIQAMDRRLSMEITDLKSKDNDTEKTVDKAVQDLLTLRTRMDGNVNLTHDIISKMETSLNATIYRQNQDVIQKVNIKMNELFQADTVLQGIVTEMNRTLIDQIVNVSKMPGPIGPRGFNGTQGQRGYPGPIGYNGSRGDPGSQGKQGPPGAGNLTLCEYKSQMTKASPGGLAYNSVVILEAADKRITGVYCHSNKAALVNMASDIHSTGLRRYVCSCHGQSSYTNSDPFMECHIAYWECPRTS